jgi:hypothetical protein
VVAQALCKPGSGNHYPGVDLNPVALGEQTQAVAQLGLKDQASNQVGDLSKLPVKVHSQDLVTGTARSR